MAEEVKLEILSGTGIFTFQNKTIYTGHIYFFIFTFLFRKRKKATVIKKNCIEPYKGYLGKIALFDLILSKKLQLIYKYFPKCACQLCW